MRDDWSGVERWRWCRPPIQAYQSDPGDHFGWFIIKRGGGLVLMCLAGSGEEWNAALPGDPWEHVSVRANLRGQDRIPTWNEMCVVKDLFWPDDEEVVQFHPPKADYVNIHPCVLHLWRLKGQRFPMPPSICVGPPVLTASGEA